MNNLGNTGAMVRSAVRRLHWPSRMSPTDALFWSLDVIPGFRSTIGVLVVLDGPLERDALRAELARFGRTFVRMHQRVAESPLGIAPPEWVDDPQFDLDYHLRSIAAPSPGRLDDVLDALAPLFATPFDRSRPPWETYLVEGLAEGKSAVFVKLHHCLTDGVGGSRLMSGLLGAALESIDEPVPPPAAPDQGSAGALLRAFRYRIAEAATLVQDAALALGSSIRHPVRAATSVVDVVRAGAGFGAEMVAPPAESPLHDARTASRRLAATTIPLREIEVVQRVADVTNNDVVLTIVAGAMHRWHTSRGHDVKELVGLVPVNLRAAGDLTAGNRIALLGVRLPIGEVDPLVRLDLIHARMQHVKQDRRASLYPALARAMSWMPAGLVLRIGWQQTRRANFVCTNVPGPKEPVRLLGRTVEQIFPYAPLVGDHPVSVAVLSYGDVLHVGLDVDVLGMPDLPHFLDALEESRAELVAICRHATTMDLGRTGAFASFG